MREVNHQRDAQGLNFYRKAMVMTVMELKPNGIWEESQLFPKLQEITKKHRNNLNGEVVLDNDTKQ